MYTACVLFVAQLLDECGGLSLGGSHQTQGRAHMTEVLEFMRQCKAAALTQVGPRNEWTTAGEVDKQTHLHDDT